MKPLALFVPPQSADCSIADARAELHIENSGEHDDEDAEAPHIQTQKKKGKVENAADYMQVVNSMTSYLHFHKTFRNYKTG